MPALSEALHKNKKDFSKKMSRFANRAQIQLRNGYPYIEVIEDGRKVGTSIYIDINTNTQESAIYRCKIHICCNLN